MPRHRTRTTWVARPVSERFAEQHVKDSSGCWIWTGLIFEAKGYGLLKLPSGKNVGAHRISYELYKGPIPPGAFVLHSCHNRLCVNPDHLRVGNHTDNMRDLRESGRASRGEKNVNAKLTAPDIAIIRGARLGRPSIDSLAKHFNVSPAAICFVICRYTWDHVP